MARQAKAGVPRTEKLVIRVSREEREYVNQAAERLGMSLSDFVRRVVLDYSLPVSSGANVNQLAASVAGTVTAFSRRLEEGVPVHFVPMVSMDEAKELKPYEPKKAEMKAEMKGET